MITANDPAALFEFVTALGCGLMGGVFFAFSSFVMKALARLPTDEGIAAMQAINVAAVQSWFLATFLGTTAACLYVVISSFWRLDEPSSFYLISGGAIFLVGCFLVTVIFNVPMNNALAGLAKTDPERATQWASYLTKWTAWNHVRTLASLTAAALLMLGLN